MGLYESLNFEPMLITDIFRLHNGSGRETTPNGRFAYVAASRMNNGVVGLVDSPKCPGGWLSFVKDGDGGAGTCFYQPYPFWPSNHVFGLEPLYLEMTPEALVFLATTITHQCFPKYNRGFAANARRMSRQHIMVPATTTHTGETVPDWEGMAALGRELREKTLQAREDVFQTSPGEDTELPELDFAPMLLTEVFEKVRASKSWYDKIQLDTTGVPEYPFVSRSGASNGVVDFVPPQEKAPEKGGVISLGLDTQTLGYQPVDFYTSQNIQILEHQQLNSDNAFVLMTAIRQQLGKFSWGGNGATLTRLKATHIMVPVVATPDGETVPDWDGMTAYGRAMRARVENAVRESVTSEEGAHA